MNILQVLADNTALFDATKEVVIRKFSADLPSMKDMPTAQLMDEVKARLVGLNKVEEAFKEIESHKSTPEVDSKDNPAY